MTFRTALKRVPSEFWYVLGLFLLTRVVLACIGLVTFEFIRFPESPSPNLLGIPLLDMWGVWDTKWYVQIAETGYSAVLQGLNNTEATYAFYPLYPLLMRFLAFIVGNAYVAGLLISNAALLIGGVLLYKLVRLDADQPTALRSVKYLFLYPAGFLFSSVLTEATFIALAIGCLYAARKQKWWLAGVLGLALALTKFIGVFMVIPLLVEYCSANGWKLGKKSVQALWLLLPLVGKALFMLFLLQLTGDAFAYETIMQSDAPAYRHRLANPLMPIAVAFATGHGQAVEGIFAITAIALLVAGFRTLRKSYWTYAAIAVLVPLFAGLIVHRMGRYIMVAFPLYILLAQWGKKPMADQAMTIALALLQGFFMAFWVIGGSLT